MSATAATRDSSSAPVGTENDSVASRLRARVSRAAIVAWETRNSRAMSAVLTPRPTPTGRSVVARVRATSGSARSLVVVRAPVTPITAVA